MDRECSANSTIRKGHHDGVSLSGASRLPSADRRRPQNRQRAARNHAARTSSPMHLGPVIVLSAHLPLHALLCDDARSAATPQMPSLIGRPPTKVRIHSIMGEGLRPTVQQASPVQLPFCRPSTWSSLQHQPLHPARTCSSSRRLCDHCALPSLTPSVSTGPWT